MQSAPKKKLHSQLSLIVARDEAPQSSPSNGVVKVRQISTGKKRKNIIRPQQKLSDLGRREIKDKVCLVSISIFKPLTQNLPDINGLGGPATSCAHHSASN
jgi:hypothetical protein